MLIKLVIWASMYERENSSCVRLSLARTFPACKQALLIRAARRAFLRPQEDFRRDEERFVGVQVPLSLLNHGRPLVNSRCLKDYTFPRVKKKYSCQTAN